jgi:hypothetical protein
VSPSRVRGRAEGRRRSIAFSGRCASPKAARHSFTPHGFGVGAGVFPASRSGAGARRVRLAGPGRELAVTHAGDGAHRLIADQDGRRCARLSRSARRFLARCRWRNINGLCPAKQVRAVVGVHRSAPFTSRRRPPRRWTPVLRHHFGLRSRSHTAEAIALILGRRMNIFRLLSLSSWLMCARSRTGRPEPQRAVCTRRYPLGQWHCTH